MKITSDHLARGAFIYIRQSTVDQLANNHESRRRQYGLAERARALGWRDVTLIDDDLGRSGSGVSRPGFEKLLSAICEGRVGAVFAIEVVASGAQRTRLALPKCKASARCFLSLRSEQIALPYITPGSRDSSRCCGNLRSTRR
ncbi:recombinase family protein [Mesorhizobium sp. M1005]|uniref:recombinase family protein n=1 Tax=unclassified Mesorhizobium TaxID=325217 RepID=UPI00333924D1